MTLQNASFEDAGALPGQAAHWTLTAVTRLELIAGFGAAPEDAWEDFERWYTRIDALDDAAVVRAFFDGALKGYEELESGWANAVYLYELPPALLVTCAFGGGAVDDFESGWSNAPYLRDWALVATAAAIFDDTPRESFEGEWRSGPPYAWTWDVVAASAARFDAGEQVVEDFISHWTNTTTM